MENSNNNKVCAFLSLCMLLASCAGCALAPEQIREIEVQKQLEAVIEWELNQEDKNLQKDKVLVALFLDTGEIENSTKEADIAELIESLSGLHG